MTSWNDEQGKGERVQHGWRERDALQAEYERGVLDAARAVDRHLTIIGALEGSSIHSALSGARREVLDLIRKAALQSRGEE